MAAFISGFTRLDCSVEGPHWAHISPLRLGLKWSKFVDISKWAAEQSNVEYLYKRDHFAKLFACSSEKLLGCLLSLKAAGYINNDQSAIRNVVVFQLTGHGFQATANCTRTHNA